MCALDVSFVPSTSWRTLIKVLKENKQGRSNTDKSDAAQREIITELIKMMSSLSDKLTIKNAAIVAVAVGGIYFVLRTWGVYMRKAFFDWLKMLLLDEPGFHEAWHKHHTTENRDKILINTVALCALPDELVLLGQVIRGVAPGTDLFATPKTVKMMCSLSKYRASADAVK
eukprot:1598793-Ditylum_brightwellii.AAC.1